MASLEDRKSLVKHIGKYKGRASPQLQTNTMESPHPD